MLRLMGRNGWAVCSSRRLVRLTIDDENLTTEMMDMLAKKRSPDRKSWLETNGDLAQI